MSARNAGADTHNLVNNHFKTAAHIKTTARGRWFFDTNPISSTGPNVESVC